MDGIAPEHQEILLDFQERFVARLRDLNRLFFCKWWCSLKILSELRPDFLKLWKFDVEGEDSVHQRLSEALDSNDVNVLEMTVLVNLAWRLRDD